MASINFYIADGYPTSLAGSGLGFYGAGGFGNSVAVGSYQDNTYATDSNGVIQGAQANNVKYINSATGQVAGSTNLALTSIPNAEATFKISFTHGSAVRVQNAEITAYDRVSTSNGPTGVTCYMAELIHTNPVQGPGGSGDSAWSEPQGSTGMSLADSPGISGLYAGNGTGSVHTSTRHDWYVAISASPDSIGSKTQFGMYVSLEYL